MDNEEIMSKELLQNILEVTNANNVMIARLCAESKIDTVRNDGPNPHHEEK